MNISAPFAITDAEQHAFEYYRARTSAHLAGIQDHEFWERLILQRAQVDAGVRHAIIALASFHEDFERGVIEDVSSKEQFGLKQYNLAIKEQMNLVNSGNNTSPEPEAYLPCIVFVTIEVCNLRLCICVLTLNLTLYADVACQLYISLVPGEESYRSFTWLARE